MKLVYLPEADLGIDRLYTFLIENKASIKTADKALVRIKESAERLITDSELGLSMTDGTGRRELPLSFGQHAYILRYIPDYNNNEILILRIWCTRENRET